MKPARQTLFLSLGRSRIGAIETHPSAKGTPSPTRSLLAPIPSDLDTTDAEAFGLWLRATLDDAGLSTKRAILCLERRDAVVRRLNFDTVPDPDADLPGLVRHQMQRQLSFPAEDAAIDYTLASEGDPIAVDATAAPGARLDHLRATLTAAGLSLERIALTAEGTSQLLARTALATDEGPTLIVAQTPGGIEFIVTVRGRPTSARWEKFEHHADHDQSTAADDDGAIPVEATPDAPRDPAEAIAAEARRTWMGHQLGASAEPIERIAVVSSPDDPILSRVAELVSTAAGKDARVVTPADILGDRHAELEPALLPLLGVAAEPPPTNSRNAPIDLQHPKRPPDRAALARQIAMAGILAVLLAVGVVYSAARVAKADRQSTLNAIESQIAEVATRRARAIEDAARAEHLARFLGGSVSPTEHLARVAAIKPPSDRAIITAFSLRADAGVAFDHSGRLRWYQHDRWNSSRRVTIGLRALAESRDTADALRDAFVESEYAAATTGPDGDTVRSDRYPHRIDLSLTRFDDAVRQALSPAEPDRQPEPTERAEASP